MDSRIPPARYSDVVAEIPNRCLPKGYRLRLLSRYLCLGLLFASECLNTDVKTNVAKLQTEYKLIKLGNQSLLDVRSCWLLVKTCCWSVMLPFSQSNRLTWTSEDRTLNIHQHLTPEPHCLHTKKRNRRPSRMQEAFDCKERN